MLLCKLTYFVPFNVIIKRMRYFVGSVRVRGSVRGPFFTRHLHVNADMYMYACLHVCLHILGAYFRNFSYYGYLYLVNDSRFKEQKASVCIIINKKEKQVTFG